ncbi:MAG: DAK2 domain-containing protein [Chloroflexota bacterium]
MSNLPPYDEKLATCDGQQFRELAKAGLLWLEKHQKHVNELNVFPVPDGDTGTNMLLTMRSAWKAIEHSEETHIGKVTQAFAKGALMGARGNSGVILSQIWRGLGDYLKANDAMTADDFSKALECAKDTAYKGVMKPVEGTILTVVREGAEEAVDAAEKSSDVRFILRRTLTRCRQSLERTPDLLPILKQAGVVDSGGQGLVYILEGMYRQSIGEFDTSLEEKLGSFEEAVAALPAQAHVAPEGGVLENHYDVQFILLGADLDVLTVRNTIDAMGDSTVVVGDETTIKVHVHVDNPAEPIGYAIGLGEITDVVVENMQMQMDDIIASGQVHENAEGAQIGVAARAKLEVPEITLEPGQIGVVAVANGKGLVDILKGLNVASIIEGGQTNNPSTEEIFAAIESLPTDKVILLPNNKNIILAAEAACDLSKKEVKLVPTKTIPQGISAMLAHNPGGDIGDVSEAMADQADEVVTLQITVGTRSVEIDGVNVEEGQFIGLIDGKLRASGEAINTTLQDVLAQIDGIDEKEIVTLFYGEDVTAEEAQEVADLIEGLYDELEIEIQYGGQAHYHYIMSIE